MSIATAPKRGGGATRALWENPLGTDGFEFVEYASPDPEALRDLFTTMGFTAVARHRSKNVTLFRQGGINFILNEEPDSFAAAFARAHGPSACAMAIRVTDARKAYQLVAERGARLIENHVGPMELNIPTIEGIGGVRFYLVDRYGSGASIYDVDFVLLDDVDAEPRGHGLTYVDHLTHNVNIGNLSSSSNGSHGHGVDIPSPASSSAATTVVMPYVQLLACEKD